MRILHHYHLHLAFLLLLVVLAGAVDPVSPQDWDIDMWFGAQHEYSRAHKRADFDPHRVGVEPYVHIANLKEDAINLAKGAGKIPGGMLIGVRGSHQEGNRAIWFSTAIHHEDELGQKMRLEERIAMLFWRLDATGKKLLHIDTFPDLGVKWGMQHLDGVLRRF